MVHGRQGPPAILRYGDERLRQVSAPVAPGSPAVRRIAGRLWQQLQKDSGVGLSAPQIGDSCRVFVVKNAGRKAAGRRLVLANPEITWSSPERCSFEEGCLSFPGLFLNLDRPRAIRVRFDDLDGRSRELAADGLLARIIQHEIDHLDGVLFVDHLSRSRRLLLTWRLRRLAGGEPGGKA